MENPELNTIGSDVAESGSRADRSSAIWEVAATRQVLDAMADLFVGLDEHQNIVFVNRALAEASRSRHGELAGREIWTIWPDMRGTLVEESFNRALTTGLPVHFEFHYPRSDAWVDVDAIPSGRYIHVYFRDITDKKRAEAERAMREETLETFLTAMPHIAWVADDLGVPTYINQRWRDYTGLKGDTMADVMAAIHPDDLLNALSTDGTPRYPGEAQTYRLRLRRRDGEYRWHEVRAAPYTVEGGPTRLIGTSTDVHEDHLAQQALRESEALAQSVVQTVVEGVVVIASDGAVLASNETFQRLHHAEEAAYGRLDQFKPTFVLHERDGREVPPDSWPIAKALRGERVANWDLLVRRTDTGREFWGSYSAAPVHGPGGEVRAAVLSVFDITDRVETERELRDAKARIEGILASADVGTWIMDVRANTLRADRNLARMFELDEAAAECSPPDAYFEKIHPDDRTFVGQALALSIAEGTPYDVQYRIATEGGERWVTARGMPELGEDGRVVLLPGVVVDVTELKRAEQQLRASEERFRAAVDAIGTLWSNSAAGEMVGEQRGWAELTGQTQAEYHGFGWANAVHPDDAKPTVAAWNEAVRERKTFEFEHRVRRRDGSWGHFAIRAVPILTPEGSVREWVGVHIDITEARQDKRALEGQLRITRTIAENADSPLMLLDRNGYTTYANPPFYRVTGYRPEDTEAKTAHELMHYRYPDGRPFPAEECPIDNAYRNLKSARNFDVTFIRKDGSLFPAVAHVAPLRDERGEMMGGVLEFRDVTEERERERALRESEAQYRQITQGLPEIVFVAGTDGHHQYMNQRWYEYSGLPLGELRSEKILEAIHPEDRDLTLARWGHSLQTGEPYEIEYRLRRHDGEHRWFLGRAIGIRGDDGEIAHWFGTCTDIHEQKAIQKTLEIGQEFASSMAADLDLDRIVQALTDASTSAIGAEFGSFFYNVTNEDGDALLLFTLSGAPLEAFQRFGLPRPTHIFGPTFRAESIVRSEDITKDPRYGQMAPHFGMPKGHLPVTSYLAVPVVSRSGEVIGGLFFGHSRVGVFTEEHERIVSSFAAQASLAIDNARLYERVRDVNEELEQKVQERTIDLKLANEQLEGFTYHVSHDLRAPLRAIASTSRMVLDDHGECLPEEARRLLSRQGEAANKLSQLIDDLLKLSRLSREQLVKQPLDFTLLADEASADALADHPASDVKVEVERGLRADADPRLLKLAVINLVENAVKYSPDGGTVRVGKREDGIFFVSDEGIGMEPQYLERIFEPFQRLHRDEAFRGSGIGLANVRQVIERHGGTVWAESSPGRGSTFFFTLG